MKLLVTGTRGIPYIPGGVETHCQNLYPLIVEYGYDVLISRRSNYVNDDLHSWNEIKLLDIYSPRNKSLEAIVHTFLSILKAKKWRADIVHIHAIGPAIMTPVARFLGVKVVFTHHGPDYDRDKWGPVAKWVLRFGEKMGCLYSNEVIVISQVIKNLIMEKYNRESNLIHNGVLIPEVSSDFSFLKSLKIEPRNYIFAAARFVPEKGLHDLIQAYSLSNLSCQLVIAGDSDHEDDYSLSLKALALETSGVILTGYITGQTLAQLYSQAKLFVLPSYHEGLPISLLEALSYGVQPLVSDIPANLEVGLPEECYFHCKDVDNLREKLITLWGNDQTIDQVTGRIDFVKEKYDWSKIAAQTVDVYNKLI